MSDKKRQQKTLDATERSTEKKLKRLLRSYSKTHYTLIVIVLLLMLPCAWGLRTFVFSILLFNDSALLPEIRENKISIACKLPFCKKSIQSGDFLLFNLYGTSSSVRKVLGVPGDSVRLTAGGFVYVNNQENDLSHFWNGHYAILVDRKFYVPRAGDTLYLDSLNDITLDFALKILKHKNRSFFVEVFPESENSVLPLELAGKARIGSRPVSLRELPGLSWQELYLIGNQIRLQIQSQKPVFMKRRVFDAADSSAIQFVTVPEDMYFLVCNRAERCADSREFGFIPQSDIVGKLIFF